MSYRILSLDGGGTWALIQIKALKKIYGEDVNGRAVLQNFDMAAANSGGSIVLGGLLADLSLNQISNLFQNESLRRSIFSPAHHLLDELLQAIGHIGPKYSTEKKLPAIQHAISASNSTLQQAAAGIRRQGSSQDIHLLFVAFDYDRNRAKYFRSGDASGSGKGQGEADTISVAEAIHASTNAPVNYFDDPASFPQNPQAGRFWDGAITGNNNPVLSAVTEALVLGVKPQDIVALSIGTASVALPWPAPDQQDSPLFQPMSKPGLKTDLNKLATSILDDPPNVATFIAHMVTGAGAGVAAPADSRIVRMSPLISPVKDANGQWQVPPDMTMDQFTFLKDLDMDAVKNDEVEAIVNYTNLWIQDKAPNQPIRMNGDTLKVEVGSPLFSSALAAWNAIK